MTGKCLRGQVTIYQSIYLSGPSCAHALWAPPPTSRPCWCLFRGLRSTGRARCSVSRLTLPPLHYRGSTGTLICRLRIIAPTVPSSMLSSGWHSNGTRDGGRRRGARLTVLRWVCKRTSTSYWGTVVACTRVKVAFDGDFRGTCRLMNYLRCTMGSRPYARGGKYCPVPYLCSCSVACGGMIARMTCKRAARSGQHSTLPSTELRFSIA